MDLEGNWNFESHMLAPMKYIVLLYELFIPEIL